jgi:uncharacterized protein YgiM (DUF1202 family)
MIRAILPAVLLVLVTAAPSLAQRENADARRDRPGTFVVNRPAYLYAHASADAKILATLRPKTVIEVVEVQEQWYKVRSSTGKAPGFIRRSYADPEGAAEAPRGDAPRGEGAHGQRFRVGTFRLTSPSYVYDRPSTDAKKLGTLKEGQEVRVVNKDGTWYRIESEKGDRPPGYVPTMALKRVSDEPAREPREPRERPDPYDDPSFDPRE